MTESEFTQALMLTLSEAPGEYTSGEALDIEKVEQVITFAEAGVLTGNRGLVVTLEDGSQFQVTVVQSRMGRG